MEYGFQSSDRRQGRRELRAGPLLPLMVASWGACLNRTQVTTHRDFRPHFDNSERPAGGDLCIYCDVGFGFRFSPPIQCVPDPWGVVATWVAGKALVRRDNLRELHKVMNAALAKSESGA